MRIRHRRLYRISLIASGVAMAVALSAAPTDPRQKRIAELEQRLPAYHDRGAALYYLASLKMLVGDKFGAARDLKACLALREGFDPSGSAILGPLVKHSRDLSGLLVGTHREFPVTSRARLAFVTPEHDLVPEGLAYDTRRSVFYLSSLNRRKIVQITPSGAVSDFVPAGRYGLLPMLGIRPNPADGTVWAASWSEDLARSELLQFAADGRLLGRFSPKDLGSHGFNDLVVLARGSVILTDSLANQVYRFDPASQSFAPMKTHRALAEPNGIALTDDERDLFVADDFGVIRIELASGSSVDVDAGPRNTMAGADGLYWHEGGLVAIQNAIGAPRIATFQLADDRVRVVRTTLLEYRSDFLSGNPTTGAILGRDFFFIANSQDDNTNGDSVVDTARLEPVRIGVIRLP